MSNSLNNANAAARPTMRRAGQAEQRHQLAGDFVDHHPAGIAIDPRGADRPETQQADQQHGEPARRAERAAREPQQQPEQRAGGAWGKRQEPAAEAAGHEPRETSPNLLQERSDGMQHRRLGQRRRMADARQRNDRHIGRAARMAATVGRQQDVARSRPRQVAAAGAPARRTAATAAAWDRAAAGRWRCPSADETCRRAPWT